MLIKSRRLLTSGQMTWLTSFVNSEENKINDQPLITRLEMNPAGNDSYAAAITISDDIGLFSQVANIQLLKILLVVFALVCFTCNKEGMDTELAKLQKMAQEIKNPKAISIVLSGIVAMILAETTIDLKHYMQACDTQLEISKNKHEIDDIEATTSEQILWKFKSEIHLTKV